jgi:hypothetical protein
MEKMEFLKEMLGKIEEKMEANTNAMRRDIKSGQEEMNINMKTMQEKADTNRKADQEESQRT